MCGIAGILRFGPVAGASGGIDRDLLARMTGALAHRGPDGQGIWVAPDGRAGLGHRRLTIIDLSDNANQPMPNGDSSKWIVFNGEIWNHVALRTELVAAGYKFRTDHSDTEVLIHGFDAWGIAGLLPRLQGMFAFAIWDDTKKRLTLARDRVGVKPVYFTRHDGEFHFASEIKGLLADGRVPRRVCNVALYHYLTYLTTPAPLTMFDGIYKLPCSTYLEIEADGAMRSARYWDAVPGRGIDADRVARLSESERTQYYIDGIRERLDRAVEKRMMSDVPYGAFLSGGIDSSANVALMDRYTDAPVNTFTVGFSDYTHLNELDHARRIATLFKTNHHEVLVNEGDMMGYIADLVHQQDEPLADWVCIPLHFVSELAKNNGIKVVQVGEGSDEQFCGYRSYMGQLSLHRAMGAFPKFVQRGMAFGARTIAGSNVRLGLYADIAERMATGREPFWSGSIAFWEAQKKSLLGDFKVPEPTGAADMIAAGLLDPAILRADSFEVARSFLEPFDRKHPGRDQLTRMIHNEFKLRLPELLLMRVDKISMASSLEAREPFLDHDLVEFTMDIPQSAKVQGREAKHLLKRAVTGLIPDDIIHRKKQGFAAPMSDWLKGDFGARVEREIMASPMLSSMGFDRAMVAGMIADHRTGRRDTALPVWVIYNLVAWHAHWIEGTGLRADAA